ncbi:MAG: hypothetical protein M3Y04_00925 [Actinomycetota bacterium]|nr:hypothetical protein [Actinomycetota bacterium]
MAADDFPPVPERPEPQRARTRVLVFTVLGAVLAAALIIAIVGRVGTGTGGGIRRAGSNQAPTFDVGPATQRAASIDRSGPLLFPDPRGGTLDIYVQHLGGAQWAAFAARATGAGRQCVLRWDQGARHFVDPCDGRVYPADGTGLVTFPAAVNDKGRVIVDLTKGVTPTSAPDTVPIPS